MDGASIPGSRTKPKLSFHLAHARAASAIIGSCPTQGVADARAVRGRARIQRARQHPAAARRNRRRAARRVDYEVVYVDDASSDDSFDVLKAERAKHPELRIVRHLKQSGQSTAIRNGVRAARGAWIATLDGDGQNDPADIPKLFEARQTATPSVKPFAAWRTTR